MLEAIIVVAVIAVFMILMVTIPEVGIAFFVVLVGIGVYAESKSEKEYQQKIETAPCRDFSDVPITEVPARCKEYFETTNKKG